MVDAKKLELRNARKQKKYTFVVKESKFSASVKRRWRFPRGKHSKVRQMHKGRPALPSPGYGSPKAVYGLTREGLREVIVANVNDLNKVDPKTDGVVLSRTLGKRKTVDVLKAIQDKKLTLLNVKDVSKSLDSISSMMDARKKSRAKRLVKKEKKEKDASKKAEAKESKKKKSKVSDEEKKTEAPQKVAEPASEEKAKPSSKGKDKTPEDHEQKVQK